MGSDIHLRNDADDGSNIQQNGSERVAQLGLPGGSEGSDENESSNLFLSSIEPELWYDMVVYMSDSNDGVRSYLEKYQWLDCFILPFDPENSSRISDFQGAHVEFELRPAEFIRHIETFSKLLKIRDLCEILLMDLGEETDEEKRDQKMQSWMEFHTDIQYFVQPLQSSDGAGRIARRFELCSSRLKLSLQKYRHSGQSYFSTAADQMQNIFARRANIKEVEKRFQISYSLRETRRGGLRICFNSASEKGQIHLLQIANMLKERSKDSRFMSAEHRQLQSSICLFVEAKTGQKGLQYREAIDKLREISFMKAEQSKILYEAIERQRTEIALQQQIITCLEYRFALEHLPQMDTAVMKHLLPKRPTEATPRWKATWKLAVERELEEMIKDYMKPFNPGNPSTAAHAASAMAAPPSTGTTSSSAATPATSSAGSTAGSTSSVAPSSLRAFLQSDFDIWAKYNSTKHGPLKVIPPDPSTASASRSQVDTYRPTYEKWSSYAQGLHLYSELSKNIHSYNKSFDIPETSFTKSQRDILKWLKPDPNAIDSQTREVDWRKVWDNRGLPA